ncbi:probable RNA helicase armi [Aphidius gifuensis]|uniref:probable RNA helicase armi n=1 Tax=Aphidius gifuensis TaxID=684658 RepID=UPI001CDCB5E9|nr:probable RNA helicase armi [Aphidius gifuensis]
MLSVLMHVAKSMLGYSTTEEPSIDDLIARIDNANINTMTSSNKDDNQTSDEMTVGAFYKSGTITQIYEDSVVIDDHFICDLTDITINKYEIGTKVNYLGYLKSENDEPRIRKIISICDGLWDNNNNSKTNEELIDNKQIMNKFIVDKVKKREGRKVYFETIDKVIDLNKVESTFVPYVGDWIQLESLLEVDELSHDLSGQVLEVNKIQPLRSKIKIGLVTKYDAKTGVGSIEKDIVFNKYSCETGYIPRLGDKVVCDCIESDQGIYIWRCLTVVSLYHLQKQNNNNGDDDDEDENNIKTVEKNKLYDLEQNKNGITITNIDSTIMMEINEEKEIKLIVKNSSNNFHIMNNIITDDQSQLEILSLKSSYCEIIIEPNESIEYLFKCFGKFVGSTVESITFSFEGFKIRRSINIIVNPTELTILSNVIDCVKKKNIARQDNYNQASYIQGIRPVKPPNFIKVRSGVFRIPQRYWDLILPLINDNKSQNEIEAIVSENITFLTKGLNAMNYRDRFHALLYLEEIGLTIEMQKYDIDSGILIAKDDYLVLNVPGLVEKRPSLIIGDRCIVKFRWDSSGGNIKYEGCIHKICSTNVLLKFNPKFHEIYHGEDCIITFKSSYSSIGRCHNAVNLAILYLGPELLFPTYVKEKLSQTKIYETISSSDIVKEHKLNWFNKKLNKYQKDAVYNILLGIARPLPYVIFGPPGTGKTVTLCESILQIFTLIPDSRILIATPSNSSANLISERLLDSNVLKPGNLIRLIAHHCLDDDSIPEKLLPYCATASLAAEGTASNYKICDNGTKLNCTMSILGRHRITIGTCNALGILYNVGFPRGHFTHIVIDEAGQATEPEIMIPLTFTHSDHGQIILAGDPMQLGPVVTSKLADSFGLGESFLVRLLQQFPYQRDNEGFNNGYDPRLVTKLLMNYRSLPEILELPNALFYDSDLVAKLSNKHSKEAELLNKLTDILPTRDSGITPAIVFHGVNGENRQDIDSPSWYNTAEATQIYLYLTKLYNNGLTSDDIGIITPYKKQVRQIRDLLQEFDVASPKVGSVEEFQGQERNVIIVSAVRTTEDYIQQDIKHSLGFVASPRRLNVAITRARALLIIIGHPTLLSQDPYWRSVIVYCKERNCYTGCNFSL